MRASLYLWCGLSCVGLRTGRRRCWRNICLSCLLLSSYRPLIIRLLRLYSGSLGLLCLNLLQLLHLILLLHLLLMARHLRGAGNCLKEVERLRVHHRQRVLSYRLRSSLHGIRLYSRLLSRTTVEQQPQRGSDVIGILPPKSETSSRSRSDLLLTRNEPIFVLPYLNHLSTDVHRVRLFAVHVHEAIWRCWCAAPD